MAENTGAVDSTAVECAEWDTAAKEWDPEWDTFALGCALVQTLPPPKFPSSACEIGWAQHDLLPANCSQAELGNILNRTNKGTEHVLHQSHLRVLYNAMAVSHAEAAMVRTYAVLREAAVREALDGEAKEAKEAAARQARAELILQLLEEDDETEGSGIGSPQGGGGGGDNLAGGSGKKLGGGGKKGKKKRK